MRSGTKFILANLVMHFSMLVLIVCLFRDNFPLLLGLEVLIVVSALLNWSIYKDLAKPLKALAMGIHAIRDRDFSIKFKHTGKSEVDELVSVYNDMVDRLRKERTLQEEQHFFLQKLIETSPTGVIILDYEQRVLQMNPQAARLAGVPQTAFVGKLLSEVSGQLGRAMSRLAEGSDVTLSLDGMRTYKIQRAHFVDRGFARQFLLIEELSTELLAAERAAYGKVIRMMAHEVNNTIGAVNCILQSAGECLSANDVPLAEAVHTAYQRNNNLNGFMQNFAEVARLPPPQKRTFDLHPLILRTIQVMGWRTGNKEIRFETDFCEGPFLIEADALQMEQVLINVIKNSIEAIESKGTISCLTQRSPMTLMVRDNGKGIPEDVSDRLFSPFFSTKRDGQGVGLTIIKEILGMHGFSASLRTIGPGNTAFIIHLQSDDNA